MRLEATDLSYAFRGARERAITIPALAAEPGTLTVIAGPSGSGKTTLLYLLSGLLAPQGGTVHWAGVAISALNETGRDRWRRRHAGYVFQNFHLIEDMTPRQNAAVAAYFAGWSARRYEARAKDLLARFGVPDVDRPAATLSRGEQQRVAFARALLLDPAVLFADEPTASLDAENADTVAATLAALAREQGKTVIAVSHDPAVIERADQTVWLERGAIAYVAVAGKAAA